MESRNFDTPGTDKNQGSEKKLTKKINRKMAFFIATMIVIISLIIVVISMALSAKIRADKLIKSFENIKSLTISSKKLEKRMGVTDLQVKVDLESNNYEMSFNQSNIRLSAMVDIVVKDGNSYISGNSIRSMVENRADNNIDTNYNDDKIMQYAQEASESIKDKWIKVPTSDKNPADKINEQIENIKKNLKNDKKNPDIKIGNIKQQDLTVEYEILVNNKRLYVTTLQDGTTVTKVSIPSEGFEIKNINSTTIRNVDEKDIIDIDKINRKSIMQRQEEMLESIRRRDRENFNKSMDGFRRELKLDKRKPITR